MAEISESGPENFDALVIFTCVCVCVCVHCFQGPLLFYHLSVKAFC